MGLFNPTTLENVRIANKAIRSQFLRTVLTILIIALGISTLIAINTISEAIKSKINAQFSKMGSNTLVISQKNVGDHFSQRGQKMKVFPPISYREAQRFKENFTYDAITSTSAVGSFASSVKYGSNKTSPNVKVLGCDNQYLELNALNLAEGRLFSENELNKGSSVAIVGKDIVKTVLKGEKEPIGKVISIGANKYTVVGIIEEQGSTFGMSNDNQCLLPLMNLKKKYGHAKTSYTLNVKVLDAKKIDEAQEAATHLLRSIRKDRANEENSFRITKSEQLANDMNEGIGDLSFYISIIGYITLLGAGIGLMNIMLVSVTERTAEIGLRKAVGASALRIKSQFLIEAIVIGQIGGIIGILLGLVIGNIIALIMGIDFIIPWLWITIGFVLCLLTSVLSGYLPASKASKLDPIESLRYE